MLKIIHWQFQNPSINLEINSNNKSAQSALNKGSALRQVSGEPAKVTILKAITPI